MAKIDERINELGGRPRYKIGKASKNKIFGSFSYYVSCE